jgi:hypothetical protein
MALTSEPQARSTPVVAVLAAHWEAKSEEGWITRQVAGALACRADVHIITPEGLVADESVDGAFTLHRLATPIDSVAELRRDLLVESLSGPGMQPDAVNSSQLSALLDRDLLAPWRGAADLLSGIRPDLVVIAGHRNVGALSAVERSVPNAPLALVALGSSRLSLSFPHFDAMFDRAAAVLTVTDGERQSVIEHHGRSTAVHCIGAPLAANPSALTEPNGWVGASEYIMVVTNSGSREDHVDNELSRIIRLRFPDNPVGVSHTDSFCVWHQGRLNEGWAVQRSSDMARLMAWARVTVDLHPGALFARRCLDSLLYGTPIVVPHDSRAREHAERGCGGLWFSNPSELIWCIEALLDAPTRDTFGAQGRAYSEAEYGSTDRFIDQVVSACGLSSDLAPTTVRA